MADDYTDLIMPIDYTPDAFQYANRKRYDKWKMIGMQFSHPYFKGINTLGSGNINTLGPLQGVVSGCRPIEEINQHNHIIGRGGWYLRARRDGDGNNSATYGIIGHCHQPDAKYEVVNQYPDVFFSPTENSGSDPYPGSIKYSPMERNWGFPMDANLCSCASDSNFTWAMGVFTETTDGVTGKKSYGYQGVFNLFQNPNFKIGDIDELGKSYLSQGNGFFSAYILLAGGAIKNYRTCEAISQDIHQVGFAGPSKIISSDPVDMCVNYSDPIFTHGATPASTGLPVIEIDNLGHGVIVKLTSLPSCGHFDMVKIDRIPCSGSGTWKNDPVAKEKRDICCNTEYVGYDPNDPICFQGTRCERAAIRIMPMCNATFFEPDRGSDKYYFEKHFPTIEKHFDRWDRVIGDRTLYKIFDELFEIPEVKMRVRVVTHNLDELKSHFNEMKELVTRPDNTTYYRLRPDCMYKKYLTGGQPGDSPSGPKGCSCTPAIQNENNYPIRPYNEFVYCPNNFSCQKTC